MGEEITYQLKWDWSFTTRFHFIFYRLYCARRASKLGPFVGGGFCVRLEDCSGGPNIWVEWTMPKKFFLCLYSLLKSVISCPFLYVRH